MTDIRIEALSSIIPNHGGSIVNNAMKSDIIICSRHLKTKDFNFMFPRIDVTNETRINWKNKHFVTPDFITQATIHRKIPSFQQYQPQCVKFEFYKQSKQEKNNNNVNDVNK